MINIRTSTHPSLISIDTSAPQNQRFSSEPGSALSQTGLPLGLGIAPERPPTREEIQERIRQRYLERLVIRARKIRKAQLERDWETLFSECEQLATSAAEFGLPEIAYSAREAKEALRPLSPVKRRFFGASSPTQPSESFNAALKSLLKSIDTLLAVRI